MPALVSLLVLGPAWQITLAAGDGEQAGQFRVGWASADLTPAEPVVLTGFVDANVGLDLEILVPVRQMQVRTPFRFDISHRVPADGLFP